MHFRLFQGHRPSSKITANLCSRCLSGVEYTSVQDKSWNGRGSWPLNVKLYSARGVQGRWASCRPGLGSRKCSLAHNRATEREADAQDSRQPEKEQPKGFGAEEPGRTTRRPSPSLQARQQDQAGAKPPSETERTIVTLLSILFLVVLAEGLTLAFSGFLPLEADTFATAIVYPAFSPTVGTLLAGSVLYGLWKVTPGNQDQ